MYVIAACNQRESHQPRLQLSEATGRRLLGNCYDCFWVYSTYWDHLLGSKTVSDGPSVGRSVFNIKCCFAVSKLVFI